MAFKLKKSESASAGIRRIARDEAEEALKLLEEKSADPDETVHELRKHFKKIRAIMRLVRDELGEEIYRRDNGSVRELGRRLASARDASVRVSALDRLRSTYEKEFPVDEVSPIRKRLVARSRAVAGRLQKGSILPAIARELDDLRSRVRAWPLQQEAFGCVEPGLRRTYRQGRKGEAEAYASRTNEAFHEWRKRAKDLRYHVTLLESVWPEAMKDLEKAMHDLTDRLGDDHDFSELRLTLASAPKGAKEERAATVVIELIDRRRSELQAAARPLGIRTYAEKPGEFARRIGSYWAAWRSCPDD